MDSTLIKDYAGRYHLSIEVDDCDTYITIWCWKPRQVGVSCDQRAGVLGSGASIEAQRGDQEIRELFNSVHTPKGKLWFDECGHVTLGSHLGDVCDDYQGSPMVAEPSESQNLLPHPHWVSPSHPTLLVPQLTSPITAASHWVQAMSQSSSHSGSRASSTAGSYSTPKHYT